MPMTAPQIEALLRRAFPDAQIELTDTAGDGDRSIGGCKSPSMGFCNSLRCGTCPQLAPRTKHSRVWFSLRRIPAAPDRALKNARSGARIVSAAFRGKTRVQQHQLVYAAIGADMGGALHALALQTASPD